jgi:hypothetical protein
MMCRAHNKRKSPWSCRSSKRAKANIPTPLSIDGIGELILGYTDLTLTQVRILLSHGFDQYGYEFIRKDASGMYSVMSRVVENYVYPRQTAMQMCDDIIWDLETKVKILRYNQMYNVAQALVSSTELCRAYRLKAVRYLSYRAHTELLKVSTNLPTDNLSHDTQCFLTSYIDLQQQRQYEHEGQDDLYYVSDSYERLLRYCKNERDSSSWNQLHRYLRLGFVDYLKMELDWFCHQNELPRSVLTLDINKYDFELRVDPQILHQVFPADASAYTKLLSDFGRPICNPFVFEATIRVIRQCPSRYKPSSTGIFIQGNGNLQCVDGCITMGGLSIGSMDNQYLYILRPSCEPIHRTQRFHFWSFEPESAIGIMDRSLHMHKLLSSK